MRTELPKIESPPTSTAIVATAATGGGSSNGETAELPVVTKESHLLNKVAAALPLLPPLPTTEPIDHTKQGNQKHNARYKVL